MTILGGGLLAYQLRPLPYLPPENGPVLFPEDGNEKTEWAFGRLAYDGFISPWGQSWSVDYPKADRQFVQGVRRLTRLHTRSTEEVVGLDSDEIFDWPWIYAVEAGYWKFNDEQAKRLREYLLKGGFLMVDDFHGTFGWRVFEYGLRQVFPDRPIVELDIDAEIFHVSYEVEKLEQVPGLAALQYGLTYEPDKPGSQVPHWRAVLDDQGRVMVAISYNQDLGDAWEHADWPLYPEHYASLAYRIGVNYILYSMTH